MGAVCVSVCGHAFWCVLMQKRRSNNGEIHRRGVDASCLRPPSIGRYRCLSEQECEGKHGLCAHCSGVIQVEAGRSDQDGEDVQGEGVSAFPAPGYACWLFQPDFPAESVSYKDVQTVRGCLRAICSCFRLWKQL